MSLKNNKKTIRQSKKTREEEQSTENFQEKLNPLKPLYNLKIQILKEKLN